MNDIYFALDKHSRIQLLQLDLSSAFDSISHDILINRLSKIDISGEALKILIQLIKDRTHSVKIHDCISCENISLCGFHRNQIRSSTFYYLYFFFEIYNRTNTKCEISYIYADDIQIYAESCHHDKLMLCANNIRKWLLNNNVLINSSQTMLLNISLSNFVIPDIIFDNLLITPSSKIKFLGIIVSCNLSQSDHVSYICKSAN